VDLLQLLDDLGQGVEPGGQVDRRRDAERLGPGAELLQAVAAAADLQPGAREVAAQPGERLGGRDQAVARRDQAVVAEHDLAGRIPAQGLGPGDEEALVGAVHHHGDGAPGPGADLVRVRLVHGQHLVREPERRLLRGGDRGEHLALAGELRREQLRGQIVHVEQQRGAEEPRHDRGEDQRLGHRVRLHQVERARPGAQPAGGAGAEAAVERQVRLGGAAPVLAGGQVHHLHPVDDVDLGAAGRGERDHGHLVTACGQRLRLAAHARVRFVLAHHDHADPQRAARIARRWGGLLGRRQRHAPEDRCGTLTYPRAGGSNTDS
jgi:hypothetical protein